MAVLIAIAVVVVVCLIYLYRRPPDGKTIAYIVSEAYGNSQVDAVDISTQVTGGQREAAICMLLNADTGYWRFEFLVPWFPLAESQVVGTYRCTPTQGLEEAGRAIFCVEKFRFVASRVPLQLSARFCVPERGNMKHWGEIFLNCPIDERATRGEP